MIVERFVAETTPVATDCSKPSGAPTVMTHSPVTKLSESPMSAATRPDASLTFSTAMSELLSPPTYSASRSPPSTLMVSLAASSTTW